MIVFHKPGAGRITATDEQYLERTKDLIGEGCPPLELISTSIWIVRETVAEYYSVGRVHCAGDAVHRHPPFNVSFIAPLYTITTEKGNSCRASVQTPAYKVE